MRFLKVRLSEFGRQWQSIEADARVAFQRVGASGWYILGDEVRAFEAALAEAWPIAHAVGTGNGLDAIEIGLRTLDVGEGDLVLTTPLSAFATTLAVLRTGATPVFADVDACGLLDLDLCRRLCAGEPRIRCLLPVHLYGHALDLEALESLGHDFDLLIVEDCAQSIHATWGGRPTGSVGQVAATSFYPTKNLGAMGDGGAVLTRSAERAEAARALRHYGQSATYVHGVLGLNSRLDELHAAILLDALLPRLADWTARRRQIATHYEAGLENRWLATPPKPPKRSSAWHLFPILVAPGKRASFVRHLEERGVATGVHYPRLIPEQRALRRYGRFQVATDLENARRFAADEVSLPIHPFLTDQELDHVVASCNEWRPD